MNCLPEKAPIQYYNVFVEVSCRCSMHPVHDKQDFTLDVKLTYPKNIPSDATTTWHLQRQESLKPSPRSLKRPRITEAPSATLELLKITAMGDLVAPSGSRILLSPQGDEVELVKFNLDSSYTS